MSEHVLLSTVGVSDYEQTRFVLTEDQEVRAKLASVALVRLLDIDAVILAHTTTVREQTTYLDHIREVCTEQNVDTTFVEVPLVTSQNDVDQILDRVGATLADTGAQVVSLDITHAYRSLSLALYTTVTHLTALDIINIDGLYYAERAGKDDSTPVLDLTYLYTLLEWHHALRSSRTSGTLGPLQELLQNKRKQVYNRGGEDPDLVSVTSALNSVSSYLDAGLPLEAGVAARHALAQLESLDERDFVGPEGVFLDPLADQLERFVVNQDDVTAKGDIELTEDELRRQRNLVQFYVETRREWLALECARELFLNRVLFDRHGNDINWLDTDIRHQVRNALTEAAIEYRSGNRSPPEAIRLWDELSQYRNMHAHAGFDPNRTPIGDGVTSVVEQVCHRIDDPEFWQSIVN